MANFKKELKQIMTRFDAAQEAFVAGADRQKKAQKKLKAAKAKILSLEQKIANLEKQLADVVESAAKDLQEATPSGATASVSTTSSTTAPKKKRRGRPPGSKTAKAKTGKRRGRPTNAERAARAAATMPEEVSEAAAEKPAAPKRRGRPPGRKNKTATTKATTTASGSTSTGKRRRGRPSTKPAPSVLTKIKGVGETMAKRFEEAGVTTITQFSKLSDKRMKEVFEQCGPRYRNVDAEKMESYRQAAKEAKA